MSKILFIPLNKNHVLIFQKIRNYLNFNYEFVCHDRLSESAKYHTEMLMIEKNIPYCHFGYSIKREVYESIFRKINIFFRIKHQINKLLSDINPDIVVFAMDNDPIARLFIDESKRRNIKTILVQEALLRPYEYADRKLYLTDIVFRFFSFVGIYLKYSMYGSGGCDLIIASGSNAKEIFCSRGVPRNNIILSGYPKYDSIIKKIKRNNKISVNEGNFLYAASTSVISNKANIRFLKSLVDATRRLSFHLIIKLHPRGTTHPSHIKSVLKLKSSDHIEIIKEGDDTFSLLSRAYLLITVSSTSALEALLMDKECILVNYLAGEAKLEYSKYDAVYSIENENEIYYKLKMAALTKKSYNNKKRLLEDELHLLDGKAAYRAANIIESINQ